MRDELHAKAIAEHRLCPEDCTLFAYHEGSCRPRRIGICAYCDHVDEDWDGRNGHPFGEGDACGPVMSPADLRGWAVEEVGNANDAISAALLKLSQADEFAPVALPLVDRETP